MTCEPDRWLDAVWRLLRRIALTLLVILGGIYVLFRMSTIIAAVMVAVLLTYVLLPSVEALCAQRTTWMTVKTQRLVSTLLVFIGFFALVSLAVVVMFIPFKTELIQFQSNLTQYSNQLEAVAEQAGTWYADVVPDSVKHTLGKLDYNKLVDYVTSYGQRIANILKSSVAIVLELVLIPVLTFYFLLDYKSISKETYGLIPRSRRREAVRIGRRIGVILQSYIFGQLILCGIAGVTTAIFLSFMHLPYILVLALIAGITRAIPIIGPVVSGIPIVLVGMLNSHGIVVPLYLLCFITIMHFAESKFIMPRLIGDRLHLHPAIVIIVLLIGAEFFGLIGMFLAAPVAALMRDLIRFYYVRPRQRDF